MKKRTEVHFLINGSKAGNEQRWWKNVIGAVEKPGQRFPISAVTLKASLFYWFTVEQRWA